MIADGSYQVHDELVDEQSILIAVDASRMDSARWKLQRFLSEALLAQEFSRDVRAYRQKSGPRKVKPALSQHHRRQRSARSTPPLPC